MTSSYCIQEIEAVLANLPLPNPRFLAAFLVGLLTCQKARFAKIANAMPGNAKPESQEMRLRRYLDHPDVNFAPALAALLPKPAPWVVVLDRTNWQRGETDINLLTVAVLVGKTAVPLLWCELSHPGNSDTAQRMHRSDKAVRDTLWQPLHPLDHGRPRIRGRGLACFSASTRYLFRDSDSQGGSVDPCGRNFSGGMALFRAAGGWLPQQEAGVAFVGNAGLCGREVSAQEEDQSGQRGLADCRKQSPYPGLAGLVSSSVGNRDAVSGHEGTGL